MIPMKRIIFIRTGFIIIGGSVHSCKEALDIENTQSLSDLAVWNSETSADMYVTASYKTFSDVSQVAESRNIYYDSYSDLMKSTSWDQYTHGYNKSLLQESAFTTGSAGAFDVWADLYGNRIRR